MESVLSDRSDKKVTKYHSDIAYGPLVEGYAICGGYADTMKLFLDKLSENIWLN